MKALFYKLITSVFFFFFTVLSLTAQSHDELWSRNAEVEVNSKHKVERRSIPNAYEIFQLDIDALSQKLQNTPKRKGKQGKSSSIIGFPTASGDIVNYEVFEASILNESLQNKYPSIKSYIGKSVDNSGEIIRFSLSKIGLHAMVMQHKGGAVFIDPYTSDFKSYMVYSKKDVPTIDPFVCLVDETNSEETSEKSTLSSKSTNANDGQLRTYRLAIATTGEYSQFQLIYNGIGSSTPISEKKEVILSAINVTMTRVNGIFERDLSLTMELVANNDDVIFLDPGLDGLTNDDGSVLISESQTVIDANIGFDNYDIGHTFSTGGGGLAQLNSPCTTNKARGITGSSYPIGDTYDIDYVAHEMGHQFGAHHTFNSDEGSCDGNINSSTAIEPGSGSTIMAYAGLCTPENVQSQSDDYFHLVSIREMWSNISFGNSSSCAVLTDTGNSAPNVSTLTNYTIPVSTPFVLSANATDADNDILTYTWEQLDTETAIAPPIPTSTEGPSFRSVAPSTSPMRYFPNQSTVIAGNLNNSWEVLPSVSRTMTFGVNVRDNNLNGGQSASKEMTLTFSDSSGPFKVTSQASATSWNSEDSKTITWDVANTTSAPVSCSNVNILLSTDGGYTYPYTLASNVPNNGSYSITVPNTTTNLGRVKVESVGNIFYAINSANISIQAKEFQMNFSESNVQVCKPSNAVYSFNYNTFLGFNETTTFSATGNPAGSVVTFNPTTATANNTTVEITISNLTNATVGAYEIDIIGTSATTSLERTETLTLNVFDDNITAPTLANPVNNATELLSPFVFEWDTNENAETYQIQIATDSDFNSIVEENNAVTSNTYTSEVLDTNNTYFWRVKAINNCGESVFSEVFSFQTASVFCNIHSATDTPLNIPDNNSSGVNSVISVTDNLSISDIKVSVNITHPYLQDLTLTLTSPNGVAILLSVSNGSSGSNYSNTIFSDDATTAISDGSAPFSGEYTPQVALSNLDNTTSLGDWTLNVTDNGAQDVGVIVSWAIDICGVQAADANDDDNDGVSNDIDLCPNSTPGSNVDALGCFMLSASNFNIEAIGETCSGKGNGQLLISTEERHTYTTTINGVDYSFSNSRIIENLPNGTYDFCIAIAEENYEQYFTITIEEAATISAKATVKSNNAAITISEGTAPYSILVNGKEVLKTSNPSFSIAIEHGDVVEVKTAIECEGVFSKNIDLFENIIAYPNPSNGSFQITVPSNNSNVTVEIYNVQSQLLLTKVYPVKYGEIQLNIEEMPSGVYFAKIISENPATLKLIKQ
ncbi:reprolysin-like metallopeptidase [Lutibacter holmesii]|uniref:Reprolysin-like metallopeptidase n=1 Tax=Lutibacter holmesii TaxID=1137985 RepID=A0ABW3WL31_9FLAO